MNWRVSIGEKRLGRRREGVERVTEMGGNEVKDRSRWRDEYKSRRNLILQDDEIWWGVDEFV